MKLCYLPIFLLFFMNSPTEAQGNFKKGLVITSKGDTLNGYINDRAWDENPEKIYFKEILESAEEKSFDINNATFFQIEGGNSYQRWTVSVSMDEVKYSKLHTGVDTSKVKKTVLLKNLVDGCYVNLYSYTDAIKTRYYFLDKTTGQPVELSYRTYYYNSGDFTAYKQKVVVVSNYIGQLKYLATKFGTSSKELNRKIENSPYLSVELSEIIVLINGNNALNFCRTIKAKERLRLFFFAGMCVERSLLDNMEVTGGFVVNSKSNHNISWMPVPLGGFDLKKNTGSRLFIREELSLSYYNLSASDVYSEPLNYYKNNYEYNLSQWNINLCSNLNYNFFYTTKLKAYMGVGIDVHFSVDVSTSYYANGKGAYGDDYKEYHDLLPPAQIWISFPITAGFIFNDRYNIYYHYHLPIDKFDSEMDNRLIKSMEIGMAYLF
jgi:hypothetical protein